MLYREYTAFRFVDRVFQPSWGKTVGERLPQRLIAGDCGPEDIPGEKENQRAVRPGNGSGMAMARLVS
ncbi:hypothetical protein Pan54_13830 [Rubinisphaera italica]|uniref:Uncharacterized protein n=1 Tax=Rubinisphaera italica TaxID=2527969 RepID=A0A5C5XDG6_9PLAN|nr:hypothetical protein Pan54_13830 [Rubinisphaera italica]